MSVPQTNNEKGFTIIEVVLVLAIGALIFLMVFIALPALQRSQRDTQRRDDLGRFMSQITNYQSNSRGNVPTADTNSTTGVPNFVNKYLQVGGDTFTDPEGSSYTFTYGVGDAPTVDGQIRYARSAECGDAGAIVTSPGNTRKVAASVKLEGGGAFCQNN